MTLKKPSDIIHQRKVDGVWVEGIIVASETYVRFNQKPNKKKKKKKKKPKKKAWAAGKKKINKRKQKSLKFVQADDFLNSFEWRRARYIALKNSDGKCQLCGRSKHDGIVLNVDHIKPRKTHPELALTQSNFQTLCHDCNHGKGNIDDTDWRKLPAPKA